MYVETFLAETFKEAEKEDQTPEQDLEERWSWITEDIDNAETRFNTQQILENSYNEMVKGGAISGDFLEALHPNSVAEAWPNFIKNLIKNGVKND